MEKKMICPLMMSECLKDGKLINGEVHACQFWINVRGKDPETGDPINREECTITAIPLLLLENAKMQYQTGAAIESLRNETVNSGVNAARTLLGMLAAPNRLQSLPNGKENES